MSKYLKKILNYLHKIHTQVFIFLFLTQPSFALEDKDLKGYDPNDPKKRPLTAKEKILSKQYVHQGHLQRKFKEACEGENAAACDGEDAFVLGETGDVLVQSISKMYSVFFSPSTQKLISGIGGGKATKKSESKSKSKGKDTEKSGKDKTAKTKKDKAPTDSKESGSPSPLCDYIPMATELAAKTTQGLTQKKIKQEPVKPGETQKNALYQVSRIHRGRANAATVQAGGWAATSTCIIASGLWNGGLSAFGTMDVIKIAASAGLASFYALKMEKHKSYQRKVKRIADKLPGKGDCNPVTDIHCYCTEPSTENDPNYCVASPFVRRADGTVVAVSCVDKDLKADPKCDCAKKNTCIDRKFVPLHGAFKAGNLGVNSGISGMGSLANGTLKAANVFTAVKGSKALSSNLFKQKELAKKIPKVTLTKEQEKEANVLKKLGVPVPFARLMAKMPADPNVMSQISAPPLRYSRTRRPRYRRGSGSSRLVYFGKRQGSSRGSSRSKDLNFLNKKSRGRQGASSGKVLNFSPGIQQGADLSRDSSKSLFKIINYRYRSSAWKKINIMEVMSNEQKK